MVFFGWLVRSCASARDVSRRFVAEVRERRLSAAYALASPELQTRLAGDTNEARTLLLVQESDGDLDVDQSGFGGTWPVVPFSCFEGESTAHPFWIVASETPGGWRVVQLRSDVRPEDCEGSE